MDLPARLGKYELTQFLGGGMSHVYRATDTLIGRTVAVKILTPEGSKDAEVRERFLQEARMAGNISHENVISIFDFGEIEGCPFMVMEFLEGHSLRHLIDSGKAGSLQEKLEIAIQAARAIEYIHSLYLIHRDIKPDNIHVNSKAVVKLIDFGIAKLQDLTRTRAGVILGTPHYMAPEQIRGERLTPSVDVYAFGVVLFELTGGVRPFASTTIEETFHRILVQEIDFTPLRQAGVPRPLLELIAQCVAKNPAERPGIQEVRQRLESFRGPAWTQTGMRPVSKSAAASTWLPKKPVTKWVIAIVAIAVVAASLAAYFMLRPTPASSTVASTAAPTGAITQPPLASTIETPTGTMILIPSGAFESGPDRQQASVGDYYIDKTEVTNGAYEQYLKARGRPVPEGFPADRHDYPVTNITIDDARDFADWAGKRLPTMLQWEKAARGLDGRLYPWGNGADARNANLSAAGAMLRPANEAGADISPWGVLNMGGNATELVDQIRTPSDAAVRVFSTLVNPPPASNEPWYTFRGGSYRLPLPSALTYEWGAVPARFHGADLGFRCVQDAHP